MFALVGEVVLSGFQNTLEISVLFYPHSVHYCHAAEIVNLSMWYSYGTRVRLNSTVTSKIVEGSRQHLFDCGA
jgi:hypothetical protein